MDIISICYAMLKWNSLLGQWSHYQLSTKKKKSLASEDETDNQHSQNGIMYVMITEENWWTLYSYLELTEYKN